jgi:type IV secretory pathway ATPase VirB11/archaellum biosynthesis ATPase
MSDDTEDSGSESSNELLSDEASAADDFVSEESSGESEEIDLIDPELDTDRDPDEDLKTYDEFQWSEQIQDVRDVISAARDGDSKASRDLRTAPTRVKEYFGANVDARDHIFDVLLPLTLVVFGLGFLLSILILPVTSWSYTLLTEPSRFADFFAIDLILMLIAVVVFVLARQRSSFGETSRIDIIRRNLRLVIVSLHFIPTIVVGGLLYLIFTAEAGRANALGERFYEIRVYWNQRLPEQVSDIGFWIWEVTPTGITVEQVGVLMVFFGVVGSIPFVIGIIKVFVIAVNIGADEEIDIDAAANAALDVGAQVGATPEQTNTIEETVPEFGERPGLSGSGEVTSLFKSPDDYKLEPYSGYVEQDRYWLKKPYCYAVILYNQEQNDHRYFVVEPTLTDVEREYYEIFVDRLDTEVLNEQIDEELPNEIARKRKVEILRDKVMEISTEYGINVSDLQYQKILYFIERNFVDYGKIDPFMNDPNIEDISCLGPNKPIVVYHQEYDDLYTNIQFENSDVLQRFIIQLAQRSDEQITKATPLQDASLPDGSRAQLSLGDEVTTEGSTFTIRRFQEVPFSPVDLLRYRTFSKSQLAYLWLCIESNKSLIFAGGTASGKTTSMNAVSLFIPPKKKIVSLEDTREIKLPHENWIPGVTREGFGDDDSDAVDMYDLLRSALRQRPEYLVVGEVRGEEAVTLFQAMSTGHTTYSTLHADSVETAFNRLKNPPIEVPAKMLEALDIMCIQIRTNIKEDGEWKTVRRNKFTHEIDEVSQGTGDESNDRVTDAFQWDAETDEFIARIDESNVLREIREEQGWTYQKVRENMEERGEVLEYLLEEDIRDIETVTRVIQAYMIDPERIITRIRDGSLQPENLRDIEDLDLESLKGRKEVQTDELLEDFEKDLQVEG